MSSSSSRPTSRSTDHATVITLENLIVRRSAIPVLATHGTYLYHLPSQSLLPKPSWFKWNVRAYDVMVSSTGITYALGWLGPIMVQGTTNGSWVELRAHYRAWVDPINVLTLLRACTLKDERHGAPGPLLTVRACRIVHTIASKDPAAFDCRERGAVEVLEREIEARLFEECGVTALIHLQAGSDHAVPPRLHHQLKVFTSDCPWPLLIDLVVDVGTPARDLPIRAMVLRSLPENHLNQVIERTVHQVMRDVTTAQLRDDTNGEPTRRLRNELTVSLGALYLTPHAVHLTLPRPLLPPLACYDEVINIAVPLGEHAAAFPLALHLHLERCNERLYFHASTPSLQWWAQHRAPTVVRHALHDATFEQLCFEPERWEAVVREALEQAASEIGYQATAKLVFQDHAQAEIRSRPVGVAYRTSPSDVASAAPAPLA